MFYAEDLIVRCNSLNVLSSYKFTSARDKVAQLDPSFGAITLPRLDANVMGLNTRDCGIFKVFVQGRIYYRIEIDTRLNYSNLTFYVLNINVIYIFFSYSQ